MQPDQKLSPNFSLSEFTVSQEGARAGLRNEPLAGHVANLKRVAGVLEQVRALLGDHRIIISSGFRSPAINALVKGALNSAHIQGLAADFICPQYGTPAEICQAIVDSPIVFDQLIQEGTWVHLGLAAANATPRREVLTAVFAAGRKTAYLKGLA